MCNWLHRKHWEWGAHCVVSNWIRCKKCNTYFVWQLNEIKYYIDENSK